MPIPSRTCFQAMNMPADPDAIPQSMSAFELYAPPNTDLWRKPPCRDTSTAPILYTALRHPFVSAEVTVSADWRLEWDQAGLVIFAGQPPGTTTTTTTPTTTPPSAVTVNTQPTETHHDTDAPPPAYSSPAPASKWVKVGLEFCNNTCNASSVCATQDGADWCTVTLPPPQARHAELRVKFERIGYALWIYYEDMHCGWKKMREVTWFFFGVEDKSVRVGVYASRPANFPMGMLYAAGAGAAGSSAAAGGAGLSSSPQTSLRVEFDDLQIF